MPLHGKIVVVKRSGVDGTEFPLTASCLFGRKPACDIRIQLPQVSKEHCRIDLNENKEVILTNLSSVNPTRVNGEALQQSERLKHGDVITIIDRSFRFEYPPPPTPKKRSSIGGKAETLKVLQDQHVGDTVAIGTGEKRISEVSTVLDPHLKDGTNHDNIQRAVEKTVEMESKEDGSLLQSKTTSPFSDLYQMIKKSLDVKTPRKSSGSKFQTPSSKFCTPKCGTVGENDDKAAISTEDTPKRVEAKVSLGADETNGEAQSISNGTPKSVKKQRRSSQVPATEMARPVVEEAEHAKSEAISPQKRHRATPQRSTISEVIEQISAQTPKSPMRRRSKDATPTKDQEQAMPVHKTEHLRKASPRNSGKVEKVKEPSKKRKSEELAADLPKPQMKKKRVSFGGYLSPELFDKKLPPDSPLRKGAAPRRSLCVPKPKQSLLRRASVIGLLKEFEQEHPDSPNVQSPGKMRTPSPKKSSSVKNASPKTPTPGKKSPKSNTSSPKAQSPGKKSPKPRTPSPKAASPGKKSPKSNTSSPKAQSPGKKSPKPKTPSPKAPGKNSPESKTSSPKAQSMGKKSPNSKSAFPARGRSPSKTKLEPHTANEQPKTPRRSTTSGQVAYKETPTGKRRSSLTPQGNTATVVTPAKTPLSPQVHTPTVQGRFSVSRIKTPSPAAEDAVKDSVPLFTVTPKIPLRRKSMKSTSRKTPSMVKSAVKVLHRRSGISRASMKALNSWADIVKFGQTKVQVAAPAKQMVNKKTMKKIVSKQQTPARKLIGHVSTGHAESPVTILVGRAHKQKVVHPTGTAPRVVTNTALFKKDMKMDEDLTGISEMFKTPANERKRRSVINENSATETPVGGLPTSVVEPSVLNTPEDPGEMIVSPLSVASTVKGRRYNSEAVTRLLNGESSFVSDTSALEIHTDDSGEQQCTDLKETSVTTPKQKPELPECLTGVKRIMKTPRQKAEPVEDIRGKLLKTPKQKPEQQECLTGVKRIMKTPRQKAKPVEDIRGKLLKTPKQKSEQQECLTGVKRIMKTPRHKSEPVEDIRGKLLKTPKQKHEQQECLTGVKRIMKTPEREAEPLEDIQGELLETPKAAEVADVTFDVKELETPAHMEESENLPEMTNMEESKNLPEMKDMKTPNLMSSPLVCLSVKRVTKMPREKSVPVEDMLCVERLMKTPKEKGEPVEENFGIKRLMKSPRLKGNAPVEDFEGLQELMEEPLTNLTEPMEIIKVEDQTPPDCGLDIAKEPDFAREEQQDSVPCAQSEDGPSDVIHDVPQFNMAKGDVNEVVCAQLEMPSSHDTNESSDVKETISQAAVEENLPEEQLKAETATSEVTEMDTTATDPDDQKKPIRGRSATTVESKAAEDKREATEHSEDSIVLAPVRGRRGKKTKATAPPAVRQTTRSRNAKSTESKDAELTLGESASLPSKVALKPKRGRNAKKASDDQTEMVQEVATETEMVPEPESEQSPPVVNHAADNSAAPLGKAVVKPKRGRKTKQESEQSQSVPEQPDVPATHSEDVLQADKAKEADAKEVSSDQLEFVPIESDENKSSDAMETVTQAPATESLPEVETATCKVTEIVQKKPVRGRRAKLVESKAAEDNQEAAEHCEDPVDPAPVRGRRGKRTAATTAPAVRQTTRGRNAKSQEDTSDDQPEVVPEKAVETKPVTEISPEATPDQTPINASQDENMSPLPEKEAVLKPCRGRKTKHTPVEPSQSKPEKSEIVSDQHLMAVNQPQQPVPNVGKQRRGRKTNPDTVEQNEVAKDTVVTVETKQPSQLPVRAKRGRNAKREEEKAENDGKTTSVETTKSQEPVKKSRRTRKAEQDHVEPQEEVPTVETLVSEEVEAQLAAEPLEMNEQATVAAKPRRGGRKAKQDTESVTPVKSTATQEVPVVSTTDKPKRGRRVKQVAEEVNITADVPEEKPDHELEAEEKQQNVESNAAVIKTSRARGAKTSVKNEISQAIPAKRARRGTAPSQEETKTEAVVLPSESALISVEPAKRGRRRAVKPTADATESSDQAKLTEDLSYAVVEDSKTSKKSVKWKADLKVYDITPAKAARSRKSKLGGQDDTESNNVSQNANKTEEKDLSDKVIESQPAKRARRGAKVTDVTTEESTSKVNLKKGDTMQAIEAETQPKTRRGRSAKK